MLSKGYWKWPSGRKIWERSRRLEVDRGTWKHSIAELCWRTESKTIIVPEAAALRRRWTDPGRSELFWLWISQLLPESQLRAEAVMCAWAGPRPRVPACRPMCKGDRTPGQRGRPPTQAQATFAPVLQMSTFEPGETCHPNNPSWFARREGVVKI